jgi:hypothetical protein
VFTGRGWRVTAVSAIMCAAAALASASSRAGAPSGNAVFEQNLGQADPAVRFLLRGHGFSALLTDHSIVVSLQSQRPVETPEIRKQAAVIELGFDDAGISAHLTAQDRTGFVSNYLRGNDRRRWVIGVPGFKRVLYRDAYPGIDVECRATNGRLEFDYLLRPHADPNSIRLHVKGAGRIFVANGDLVIITRVGDLRLLRPRAEQKAPAGTVAVPVGYRVSGSQVTLLVGAHDPRYAVRIDPVLQYSTYIGGNAYDQANAAAVDSSGNLYLAGATQSSNFPFTSGSVNRDLSVNREVFVCKLSANGSTLVFCSYFGGSSDQTAYAIAVDAAGGVYVAGSTDSADMPVVSAAQNSYGGGTADGFLLKLDPSGANISYATYLGGADQDYISNIAVDGSGSVYAVGRTLSSTFPVTSNAAQTRLGGSFDGFVTKFSPDGSRLIYSTFLGGSGTDIGFGVAVDANGNAFTIGITASIDFPVTQGAYQTSFQGGAFDVYVAKLGVDGSNFVYSTYFGGSGFDEGLKVALDSAGNAYLTGSTNSSDFPISPNAFQKKLAGGFDAFAAKLNAAGSQLLYSTFLGGALLDSSNGIAVDESGNAMIAGYTASPDFPVTSGAVQANSGGGGDGFLAMLNGDASQLFYSGFLGGSGEDVPIAMAAGPNASAYLVGRTNSSDFPVSPQALARVNSGGTDAFAARIVMLPQLNASPSSLTVAAGGTASTSLTMGQAGPAYGAFKLSCSNLPAGASCAFTDPQLLPSGTTRLSIGTATAPVASLRRAIWLALMLLPMIGVISGGTGRRRRLGLSLIAAACLSLMAGCGGGGGRPDSPIVVQKGSYEIVVSATAGMLQSTTTIRLNVD